MTGQQIDEAGGEDLSGKMGVMTSDLVEYASVAEDGHEPFGQGQEKENGEEDPAEVGEELDILLA